MLAMTDFPNALYELIVKIIFSVIFLNQIVGYHFLNYLSFIVLSKIFIYIYIYIYIYKFK